MARYIDAEELKQERDMAKKAYENANIFTATAIREHIKPLLDKIVDLPTADVVGVVRCKDCERCYEKRTKRNSQLMRFCMRMDGNEYQVNANDFCSYGTPKERGNEKWPIMRL